MSTHKATDGPKRLPLRERVLDVALELLEQEGPDAITLRAVAGAVGVSHMAPYRHFKDKEALLAALAERGFKALGQAMQDAADRRAKQSAPSAVQSDALLGYGLAYLDFARARPQLYRLMFGPALANKPQHEGLQAVGQNTFDDLSRAVRTVLQAQGNQDEEEVRALAIATWSIVHGLAMLMIDGKLLLSGDKAAEDDLIARVLGLHGRTFRRRGSA